MTTWMLYTVLLGSVIAVGASGVAGVLRSRGRPERAVWVTALLAAALLPFALPLMPRLGSTAVGVITLPGLVVGSADNALADSATGAARDGIVLLWALAVLAMAVRLWWSTRRLQEIVAASPTLRQWPVEIRSTEGTGPAVAGLRRPVVLLPRGEERIAPGERRWVLRHEFEHIRTGDPVFIWLALAIRGLVPWNPAIWYLGRRLREGMEFDCDRRVLARRPDPRSYGETLLSLASPRGGPTLPMAAFREPLLSLKRRLLAMTTPRSPLPARALALIAALSAAGWVAACEFSPVYTMGEAGQAEQEAQQEVPLTDQVDPSRIAENPTFTPFTDAPDMINREEVIAALQREYPPLLRDAGIGGTSNVWLFINASGELEDMRIQESSGRPELDEAALRVAASMRFSPALNRGEPVRVWVAFPITFQAR